MRVLLVGNIVGAYRAQLLFKILADAKHTVSFAAPRVYESHSTDMGFTTRARRKLRYYGARGALAAEVGAKARFADVIWLLPMNTNLSPLAAAAAQANPSARLVVDLYASAYASALDRGLVAPQGARAEWLRWLDRVAIESADLLVHLAQTELDHIVELVGARAPGDVEILPLAVEPRRESEPSPSKRFRIAWWGTYIPLHGIENIVGAAEVLRDRGSPVQFRMFGVPGEAHAELAAKVWSRGLEPMVELRDNCSFASGKLEEELTRGCDLALGIFGDTTKAKVVIPNKVLDAFAMRLPVLTMASTALDEMIDTRSELFTCSRAPVDIADAIDQVRLAPEEARERARRGHRRYLETFSLHRYRDGVLRALDRVRSPSSCRGPALG